MKAVLTINGKEKKYEFQNMAQALGFAFQSGECYAAQRVEIVRSEEKEELEQKDDAEELEQKDDAEELETNDTDNGGAETTVDKPLEEMSKKELVKLAKSLNINLALGGLVDSEEKIIAAIKEAQKSKDETNQTPPQDGEKPLEDMTAEELIAYAESLGIKVGVVTQKEEIIALIKAAKAEAPEPEKRQSPAGTEWPGANPAGTTDPNASGN